MLSTVCCIEKRLTPIEKVIQFMKDREYRTSEFFRILDKDGSKNLTHEELARRMLVRAAFLWNWVSTNNYHLHL